MASINLDVYKKSYMLEFVKNGAVDDVFTFSVPPENEQFDFSQRVVETKTFGGSVFENYGNDAVHITLSGSTGNGEAKLIYRGTTKTPLYLTGENEIWHLQELLQNWHDASSLTDTEERKIYLYDLSKMSALEIAAMSPSGRNWWRVIIKNFQIKRQVSKPIYYNYTLEMVGLIEEKESSESFLSTLSDTVNSIAETIDTVNNYIQGASDALSLVTEAVETVQDIYEQFSSISDADNKTKAFLLAFSSGVDTVNRAVNVNTNASFYSSTQSTLSAADSLSETIVEFAKEVYDDVTDDDEEESTTSSSSSTTTTTDSDTGDTTTDSGDDTDDSDTDGDSTDTGDDSTGGDDDTDGDGTGSTGSDSTDDDTTSGGDNTTDTDGDNITGSSDTDTDTDGSGSGNDTTNSTDDATDTDGTGSTDSGDTSTDDDTTSGSDTSGGDTDGTGDDTDTDGDSTDGSTGSDTGSDTGDDTTDTDGDSSGSSTLADGTYTASYTGDADELGEVSVTIESGAAVSVSVDSVECIQYGEGWVFANDEATYLITLDIGTSSVGYTYTIETTE